MEFIHEAGWGIWPVLVFGSISLGLALHHAVRPRRSLFSLVVGFSVATGLAGCLGSLTGLQNTVINATDYMMFFVGLRESLHCMIAAFVMVTVACLLVTAGSYRLARGEESRAREEALGEI